MNNCKSRSVVVIKNITGFKLWMVIIFLCSMISGLFYPAGAGATEIDLSIYNLEGNVSQQRAEEDLKPEVGDAIREGDVLRTDGNSTATIVIPGLTYMEIAPGSELQIHQLTGRRESRGLFFFAEEVEIREILMETTGGEIRSTTAEEPEAELELELFTPNAVMGIRGTTFDATAVPGEFSEAGVLEGEVNFRNRDAPEHQVTVGERQRSRLGIDEIEPSVPTELEAERAAALERLREQGSEGMRRPPEIDEVTLDGEALETETEIPYRRERSFLLAGSAHGAEEDVRGIRVQLNGENISPDEPIQPGEIIDPESPAFPGNIFDAGEPLFWGSSWEFEWTPPVPEEGTYDEYVLTVQALDAGGRASRPREYVIKLVHEVTEYPWPADLAEEEVGIEVEYIASFSIDDIEFPFHVYQGNLRDNELEIELSDAGLEGLAFSLDAGMSWQIPGHGGGTILRVSPELLAADAVELIAWTDEAVGRPLSLTDKIGEVIFEPLRFEDLWRQQVSAFAQAVERRNESDLRDLLDDDFIIENIILNSRGEVSVSTDDKEEFIRDWIRGFFRRARGLRVREDIQRVHGDRGGADVRAEIEYEFEINRLMEENPGSSFDFQVIIESELDLARAVDGQFLFTDLSVNELDTMKVYYWAREFTIGVSTEVEKTGIFSVKPGLPAEDNIHYQEFGARSKDWIGFEATNGETPSISIVTLIDDVEAGEYGIYGLDVESWFEIGEIPAAGYYSEILPEDRERPETLISPAEFEGDYVGDFFACRLKSGGINYSAVFEIVDWDASREELTISAVGAVDFSGDPENPSSTAVRNFRNRRPR